MNPTNNYMTDEEIEKFERWYEFCKKQEELGLIRVWVSNGWGQKFFMWTKKSQLWTNIDKVDE